MKNIDKTKPVMVTGATGYVAGWLVKKLLEEGITVREPLDDQAHKSSHFLVSPKVCATKTVAAVVLGGCIAPARSRRDTHLYQGGGAISEKLLRLDASDLRLEAVPFNN